MHLEASSPEFDRLLGYLEQTRGFDFTAYKPASLARRIDKRMQEVQVGTYADYVDYLEVHPDEFEKLFNTILINVTAFFRDTHTFDHLRTAMIPALLKGKGTDEPLRIWCAGCASGEECYSFAMLFAEALGPEQFRARVKIYATDVDDEELAIARQGAYPDRRMEGVPEPLRDGYFDRDGSKWTFKNEFRKNIIFGRHDLLDDAPISKVDLLTCRNTLMYFNHEAQARIVSRFYFALREGGYLVLGNAEMLLNFAGAFAPVDLKQRVFRKVRSDQEAERLLTGYPLGRDGRAVPSSVASRLRDISFDRDPVAQLVLDGDSHLLLANARARELFSLAARDIGRPVQDLELSYRPTELRSAIDDAHTLRHVVQLRDVAWPTAAGEPRYFNVQVTPVLDSAETSLGTKILFVDITRQHDLQEELNRSRQKLETASADLQSTNEELQTTNEELQSTVEELETTNEELQSSNEELETMNEELQATNEEMETVNQQLRQRGVDLARNNVFLGGILRHVPLAVVVLNGELHVEVWNETATELWGLRQNEVVGKHFFALDIGLPMEQLRQPLQALSREPDTPLELVVDATNRRGRAVRVKITLAHAGGGADTRELILLMKPINGD